MTTHAGDQLGLSDRAASGAAAADVHGRLSGSVWRRSLGWSSTSAPVALLLTAGLAFGPAGINLLSPATLSFLDPVVPVALAALGVLAGLGLGDRRKGNWRLFAGACLDAGVTLVLVSGGTAVFVLAAMPSIVQPVWPLVLTIGISAATSLTLPTADPQEPRTASTRVVELGVLLPIVAGGLVLAWLRAGSASGAATLVAQAIGATLVLATAGWLLLTQASSEAGERVLAVAALLLVGGVAAVLSQSALLGGLFAGFFWRHAGGRPRDTIRRDVLFVQHPLLVLVLLVAGARADVTPASLGLAASYLVLRVVARLGGGLLARSALGVRAPRDLPFQLLPPGVFGAAFALNVATVIGADALVVLTAVVIGTIASDLVTLVVPGSRARE